jgi:hypothetical protein
MDSMEFDESSGLELTTDFAVVAVDGEGCT